MIASGRGGGAVGIQRLLLTTVEPFSHTEHPCLFLWRLLPQPAHHPSKPSARSTVFHTPRTSSTLGLGPVFRRIDADHLRLHARSVLSSTTATTAGRFMPVLKKTATYLTQSCTSRLVISNFLFLRACKKRC